jgi:formate dehydrogenase subunit gamma
VARFDPAERAVHWMAAISFLYAALTGLAMWSHKLFWLASVFGGGATVRGMHPWGGVVFALALGVMFRRWAGQMGLDRDDREWLAKSHRYIVNQEGGLPEPGRFNAGQKMLFWTQSALAVLLFASGLVLWFPEVSPRALRLAAVLAHPLAAIGSIGGIIVHIYMGTAVVPGALRAMTRGWVTRSWAASHHPKWYKEISKG